MTLVAGAASNTTPNWNHIDWMLVRRNVYRISIAYRKSCANRQPGRETLTKQEAFMVSIRWLVLLNILSCVIALVGVYYSYHTDLTSSISWIKWGNNQVWVGDTLRVVTLCVFSILLLSVSYKPRQINAFEGYKFKATSLNISISLVFIVTVCYLNFYYYPSYFEQALLNNKFGFLEEGDIKRIKENYFTEVYKPYFVYFFYSAGLWFGIILPTFLMFINEFRADLISTKLKIKLVEDYDLITEFVKLYRSNNSPTSIKESLKKLQGLLYAAETSLKNLSQQYFPTIMVVFLGFAIFNILLSSIGLDGNKVLVESQTVEVKSTFGWIIIIFIVIFLIFMSLFTTALGRYRDIVDSNFDALYSYLIQSDYSHEFTDVVIEKREKLRLSNKNIITYIINTILKNGSIHIPLLAILTTLLFGLVVKDNFEELLPLYNSGVHRNLFQKR